MEYKTGELVKVVDEKDERVLGFVGRRVKECVKGLMSTTRREPLPERKLEDGLGSGQVPQAFDGRSQQEVPARVRVSVRERGIGGRW